MVLFQFGGSAGSNSTTTGTTGTNQPTFNFGSFGQQNTGTSSGFGGLNNTPTPAPATSSFPSAGTTTNTGFGSSVLGAGGFNFAKPSTTGQTTTPNAPAFGGFDGANNNATNNNTGFNFGAGLQSIGSKPADTTAQSNAQLNMQNIQRQMDNITPDDTLQKCPSEFQKLVLRIDSEQSKAKKTLQTMESVIEKNRNEYAAICVKMTALNHRLCELESCQTAVETEADALTNRLAIQRELAYKLSTNDPDVRELASKYWEYKLSTLQESHQRLQSQLLCLATALGVPANSRIPVKTMDELYSLLESLYQQARIYQIKLGLD